MLLAKVSSVDITHNIYILNTIGLGTIVQGTFKCKNSDGNSRELDVEIHYTIKDDEDSKVSDVIVQIFKVR